MNGTLDNIEILLWPRDHLNLYYILKTSENALEGITLNEDPTMIHGSEIDYSKGKVIKE